MSVRPPAPRRKRRVRRVAAVAAVLSLLAAGACGAPYQPKPLEMQPIGTVKNIPRTPVETGDASVTTPNSGTPNPAGAGGPCVSADVDNLEDMLKQCDAPMPKASDLSPLKDKLDVRVSASTTSIQAGGRVDLQVILKNKSNDAVILYFTGDPNPHFEVEALDAKGKRADLPKEKWPGYPKGVKPEVRETKAMKVTLERNGIARLKIAWDAVKTKWAPEKAKTWEGRGFPRTPAATLTPGKYNLKVVLPLLVDVDVPKVAVDVT